MNSTCLEQHIWNGCLQGTLALLLAHGICRLLPKMRPDAMSWIWRLAHLKLMIAFVFVGSICLPVLDCTSSRPASAAINHVLLYSNSRALNMKTDHLYQARDTAHILVLIWCAGVVLSGLKISAALHRTKRMLHACKGIENDELQTELAQLCNRMKINRMPQLLTGDVQGPMICGVVKPSIILPDRKLELASHKELCLILAHELAHVKRHDVMWAWLLMSAQLFFFFHPLVWLFRREWLFAQESACDLLAIQTTDSLCADYGRMLLGHVVRHTLAAEPAGIGIAEPYETLKRRINAMTKFTPITGKKQAAIWITIGILALVGIVPWMLSARDHRLTSSEIAITLPQAVYNKDFETIHQIYQVRAKAHPNKVDPDFGWNLISDKLQSYGQVKEVALEAKGKILPGLTGKGFSTGSQYVPAAGTEVSSWRVKAENGEYRIGINVRDGKLIGFEFNLADGAIGGGGF